MACVMAPVSTREDQPPRHVREPSFCPVAHFAPWQKIHFAPNASLQEANCWSYMHSHFYTTGVTVEHNTVLLKEEQWKMDRDDESNEQGAQKRRDERNNDDTTLQEDTPTVAHPLTTRAVQELLEYPISHDNMCDPVTLEKSVLPTKCPLTNTDYSKKLYDTARLHYCS